MNTRAQNMVRDAIDILVSLRHNAQYTRDTFVTHETRNSFDQYNSELATQAINLLEKSQKDKYQAPRPVKDKPDISWAELNALVGILARGDERLSDRDPYAAKKALEILRSKQPPLPF